MRIIGGEYGGRRIRLKIPDHVRPTTDLVKESMFNILNNMIDFENINVLDLFAGSGSLGIECISRGAKLTTFIEKNRRTTDLIKSLCDELKIPKSSYNSNNTDAIKFLKSKIENKYDLIFADPPYDDIVYDDLVLALINSNLLNEDCIIVIEFRTSNQLNIPESFEILSERIFGDTGFKIISLKK